MSWSECCVVQQAWMPPDVGASFCPHPRAHRSMLLSVFPQARARENCPSGRIFLFSAAIILKSRTIRGYRWSGENISFPMMAFLAKRAYASWKGVGVKTAESSLIHENHINKRAFPNLPSSAPGHQILSVCCSAMKQMMCSSVAWPFPPGKEIKYRYEEVSFDLSKTHSSECI